MNDLDELKDLVVLHARHQGIPKAQIRDVLGRIHRDDGAGPGSWVGEWSGEAERMARHGRHLDACRRYNIGRFPYADGPDREAAHRGCVRSFDRWRLERENIDRLELRGPGGDVVCWASGLSGSRPKPLLLMLGGLVSIKEQWAPVVEQARRLGAAVVVTEMPGVGENTVPYTRDSWRMFPRILDQLADRAEVARTCVVALSFSGHLAIRAAIADDRIRGVVTIGAPIDRFFTDERWWSQVPNTTTDTLRHLTGLPATELRQALGDWALSPSELGALRVPLYYLTCRNDEIIPPGEMSVLARHVADLRGVEVDDLHGALHHVRGARLWSALSAARVHGLRGARWAALDVALSLPLIGLR